MPTSVQKELPSNHRNERTLKSLFKQVHLHAKRLECVYV